MSHYDDLDAKKLASKNPKADLDMVLEVDAVVRKLREAGVNSHEFALAPPFQRQTCTTPTRMTYIEDETMALRHFS